MNSELAALSQQTGEFLRQRGWLLATAESCTGGWIAEVVTATAGSSEWFDCGFVTYSNAAKERLLGVRAATLASDGAVSEAAVAEMVAGALARSTAEVAVAVSGIAGPTGGTPAKPVGTVCIAWGRRGQAPCTVTRHYAGDREAVRRQTVVEALSGLTGGRI